jgi:hypothetical protein
MYVSSENNSMQEQIKAAKMLAFFSKLEEKDKDIVIAMAESLVEKCKGIKKMTGVITAPVVFQRSHGVCAD